MSDQPSDEQVLAALKTLRAWLGIGHGAAPAADETVTADSAPATFPGLTSRAFADAARRGEFPSRKQGRKLAAKRSDVEAWLESRKVRPRVRCVKPSNDAPDPEAVYRDLVSGRSSA